MNSKTGNSLIDNIYLKWITIITIVIMTVTGFGQMPIFKRYYIADIPGLAWTGNYYITHLIHYTGAVILLTLIAHISIRYYINKKTQYHLTKNGIVKILIFSVLIISGILKVISNQRGVHFNRTTLISLDIIHTAFTFIMLFSFAVSYILKSGWFRKS